MRSLSKIIFINSAHIRYAEVAMDGNIHFTGTQGVGKTTLLRALLFFYNCRKDRLGIRIQGQQSFDDFYIPTPASYIIYEVSRGDEESPFSIILFRHHNRAAFRFVDAPYSKDWFVDSLGVVASDQLIIRQRLQSLGIDISNIVERYNQYLDILYGNRNTVAKNLYKFYLLRSQQYHNIPRIIQNVFLNERVDANFIKNTIISSVTGEDEDIAVDLNFFRSKLVHFNEELSDISLWTTPNRQGIVETRRDADKIISISHEIKAARSALYNQCGMLNYAMQKTERDIPLIKGKIAKKEETIGKLEEVISGFRSKFEQEQKKINAEIAVLAHNLKEAARIKKEYEKININEMIARAEKLPQLKQELSQKERKLLQLTSSYRSIVEKYKDLRDRESLDFNQNLQSLEQNKNTAHSDFNANEAKRIEKKSEIESAVRDRYQEKSDEVDEALSSSRDELEAQKIQCVEAEKSSPRKEDIDKCYKIIEESGRKVNQLSRDKLKQENRVESLHNSFELKCQQIEADTTLKIKDIETIINSLKAKRKEEQTILEKAEGSLLEWLDNNVEGWENTIGKIVDEKEVLYSQHLCPEIVDTGANTLFGVSLELDAIKKQVRTPSMINESISEIESEIEKQNNLIIDLRNEKDRFIEEEGKPVSKELKAVQDSIDAMAKEIQVAQQQADDATLDLEKIKEEEEKQIKEIINDFKNKIEELIQKVSALTEESKALKEKCKKEIKKEIRHIEEETKKDKSELKSKLESIDNEIKKITQNHNIDIEKINKAEADELSGTGADTQIIETTRKEKSDINSVLERIDKEREIIAVYKDKCANLLDKVPDMQSEKKKKEEFVSRLQEKYDEKRSKQESKLQEEKMHLSILHASYKKTIESKQKAEEFIVSKACPPELKETKVVPTELSCDNIISSIQQLSGEIYRRSDDLKSSTNDFQRRFSSNNTFKFPTAFDTIDDYHRYADSLEDFVANDKIKEFQQLTSKLYRDVLSRAASDFNILLGRESEIMRIIRAINYDFEKKTFAGVIRRIELRLDRSTAPIITQLQNITDFWNAHQYELDEVNLFSTDEHTDVNKESIKYLKSLAAALNNASELKKLPLEMTFSLKFQIQENDNTTEWVENLKAVGSEGTDILVKAIVNILLISVFKRRAGHVGDFRLHCMMDEIGRLADENIQGILNFANERGIYIVNSSPKAHRPLSYRRLYMLSKDKESNTLVQPILSTREAELR